MFPHADPDSSPAFRAGESSAQSGAGEPGALRVPVGFSAPLTDRAERRLNLESHLATHPEATFYMRVSGDAMRGAGIRDGDLIVIDRSVRPVTGDTVVAVYDGEFLIRRLARDADDAPVLRAANPAYRDIPVGEGGELSVWGVVKWAIHKV